MIMPYRLYLIQNLSASTWEYNFAGQGPNIPLYKKSQKSDMVVG